MKIVAIKLDKTGLDNVLLGLTRKDIVSLAQDLLAARPDTASDSNCYCVIQTTYLGSVSRKVHNASQFADMYDYDAMPQTTTWFDVKLKHQPEAG